MDWLTDKIKIKNPMRRNNGQRTLMVENINSTGNQNGFFNQDGRKFARLPLSTRAVEQETERRKTDPDTIARLEYNASAESIRRVRMLIRQKFALDVELWGRRGAQRAMHKRLKARAARADEILMEIMAIVGDWEERHFTQGGWERARQIKESLIPLQQQIVWKNTPLWD